MIIEGDELEIVQALWRDAPCWNRYGQVIEDVRICLNSLHHWIASYTRRVANEAAHVLAKTVLHQSLDYVWHRSFPAFIQNIFIFLK